MGDNLRRCGSAGLPPCSCLVKFIIALSELPDVTNQSGTSVKPAGSWSGFRVFWRDLPVLAAAYREAPDGMAFV